MRVFSLLLLLGISNVVMGQCPWTDPTAVKWSNPTTWAPNPVPGMNYIISYLAHFIYIFIGVGANVVIPSGIKVIYDITTTGITYAGVTLSSGMYFISPDFL